MSASTPERVDLWQEPSGFWRWQYVRERLNGATPVRLLGHQEFSTEHAAVDAASTACPGVPVRVVRGGGRRPSRILWMLAVAAATLAVAAVVVRRRRSTQPASGRGR